MRWDGNEFYAKNNQFYARPHKGPFLWYATKERVCSINESNQREDYDERKEKKT